MKPMRYKGAQRDKMIILIVIYKSASKYFRAIMDKNVKK